MRKRSRLLSQLPVVALLLVGGIALAQLGNAGRSFPYVGYLEENGGAITGTRDFELRLYSTEVGSSPCDTQAFAAVPIVQGRFQVELTSVPDDCLRYGALWIAVSVGPTGGELVDLTAGGSPRVRVGAVPFAASAVSDASFITGENPLELTTASGVRYHLGGIDAAYDDTGVELRALTNPASGDALFRVLSEGGAERLRVEHDGANFMDNGLEVTGPTALLGGLSVTGAASATGNASIAGDLSVGGRLLLDDISTASNAYNGCVRLGGMQMCWGGTVNSEGGNQTVTWQRPFGGTSYRVSCTPVTGENNPRTMVVRDRFTSATIVSCYNANGAKSDVTGDCVAFGPAGSGW